MKNSRKIIEEAIDKYYIIKGDNDYVLNYKSTQNVVSSSNGSISNEEIKESPTMVGLFDNVKKTQFGICVNQKDIDRLNPDKIDINYFWEYAIEKFPFFPISSQPKCRSISDVNISNLFFHKSVGVIDNISSVFLNNENAKILEIGPGYGNIKDYISNNFSNENYHSIDVNPLFEYERAHKCDGRNIPVEIGGDIDLVYSVNVFQHLSKSQRSSYYKQIYDSLKSGGEFIFTMYLVHPQNEDLKQLWGFLDKDGRAYTQMLSQLTEIDRFEEVDKELKEIGFEYNLTLNHNLGVFKCIKK